MLGEKESQEIVLEVLKKSDKPLKAGEIVDASGLDRKAVDKAIKELKKEDKIVSPVRCFWEIKE
ncbi:MAG: HTH domain-containing protein [Candidatus Kapabacteria bacterium]|nr:HTH domain-containing protein [Candidatus Kapabacteria bacterium]